MPSCGGPATLNVPVPAKTDAGLLLCVGSEFSSPLLAAGVWVNRGDACLQLSALRVGSCGAQMWQMPALML